nr:MAG TPA: hypothetical protein [Myoviridae sp. ctfuG5]
MRCVCECNEHTHIFLLLIVKRRERREGMK